MDMTQDELRDAILVETDSAKLDDIINLFNLNIRKKDLIRADRLSDLQDKISDQISERISVKADEFSNKDLLDYFKTIQDIIGKSSNSSDDLKSIGIQINQQNNNNVSFDLLSRGLNKESRDKVVDAVQSILKKYNFNDVKEVSVVDEIEGEYVENKLE